MGAAMREKLSIICTDLRPLCKNTLRGFATIQIAELRMTMSEIAIHAKGDRAWAQPPARPWIKNGQVVRDDNGRIQYSPIIEFDTGAVRTAFSDAVIRAVPEFDEHALECRDGEAA
jgi:hypothetical protein